MEGARGKVLTDATCKMGERGEGSSLERPHTGAAPMATACKVEQRVERGTMWRLQAGWL